MDDPSFHINDMAKQIGNGYDTKGFEPITYPEFEENIKAQKTKFLVKVLMDQRSICSGIGNWILSEALHMANIHPDSRCSHLTNFDIRLLYDTCEKIIKDCVQEGGISLNDYKHYDGTVGSYQPRIYNRLSVDGKPVNIVKGKHGRKIFTLF